MKGSRLAWIVTGLLALLAIASMPARADQTFENPKANDAAVDNCAIWGDKCGWGGAHQFCQTQGYEAAQSWKLSAPGVRTYVIGSDRFCEGANCVGFSRIVCRGVAGRDHTPGRDITFDKPMINGAAVDSCVTWAESCGAGGAGAFCESQGYALAATWATYNPGRTYVIGSDRFCEGAQCTGLARVACVAHHHPDHPPDAAPQPADGH